MVSFEALFKISYGLFIVASGDKQRGNGFISNTVFQVTAEPPKFAACCNKNNYTCGLIQQSGAFSVSILHTGTSPEIFGRFGYKSGKDTDKFDGMSIKYGETGAPIVMNDCIAYLECKVVQTVDVGTHIIFIGELVASEIIDDSKDPITYLYYRQIRKGVAPKNAPTYIDKSKFEKSDNNLAYKSYKCVVCGFVYDEAAEGKRFSELPDDWVCPVCGSEKSEFIEI
jgi:flavin reductase (DIM6/NTAB) family NADH-FMN oxidoreductase RutF/rubredoxin